MRKMFKMRINGELRFWPRFKKGDRVRLKNNEILNEEAFGTVMEVEAKGLFVKVKWDKREFKNQHGNTVILGNRWMVDKLERIEIEK
jgi:hypothetical protein